MDKSRFTEFTKSLGSSQNSFMITPMEVINMRSQDEEVQPGARKAGRERPDRPRHLKGPAKLKEHIRKRADL